ncbi:hypothetical protein HZU72_03605 [Halomonas sp. QX-2]|uniref:Uncharacterized protein n=1 Tax=Vreelandella sedimenti TaxID=2729618 RepID=A0A7Z0SLA4_9GAMM|nr:hypothetical protein [Halomonas sedimenti]NYT71510.1 hypothetical protein [Halomonas sedimenti]
MSDFRKFQPIEATLMKIYIALVDSRPVKFSVLAAFSAIILFYFDVFGNNYLIPNTTDTFYRVNMIGVHIVILHFITLYAVRFIQESLTNILDTCTGKLAYANYKTIVERHGKEALRYTQ